MVVRLDQDQIFEMYQQHTSVLGQTAQHGCVTHTYMFDHVRSLGGHCLMSVGDLYMHDTEKYFYTNIIDYTANVFRNGEHPTAFFAYTPEIQLSYVLQFNTDLDWQYNKCQFYDCVHRPKADYLPPLRYIGRLNTMMTMIQNKLPVMKPHIFGNKQQTIDFLLGNT